MKERTKNISKLKLCARSMKREMNVSQTARAITAIYCFRIRIPAEETLSSFMVYVPVSLTYQYLGELKQKHHKGLKIIKIAKSSQ
jgi:hypothetical protein